MLNQWQPTYIKMKIKNNVRYATSGLSSLLLTIAIAATDHNLAQAAQNNTEQIHAIDAAKYNRVAVLAGDKRAELEKKKLAVENAYKKWNVLKLSAEKSSSPRKLKAVETAAQAYSQANLELVNLEKEILIQSGIVSEGVVLSDVVNALNAVAPSAGGPPAAKPNNPNQNSMHNSDPVARPLP